MRAEQNEIVSQLQNFIKNLGGGSYFEYVDNAGSNVCAELFRTVKAKISNIETQLYEEKDTNAQLRQKLSEYSMQRDELEREKSKIQ